MGPHIEGTHEPGGPRSSVSEPSLHRDASVHEACNFSPKFMSVSRFLPLCEAQLCRGSRFLPAASRSSALPTYCGTGCPPLSSLKKIANIPAGIEEGD